MNDPKGLDRIVLTGFMGSGKTSVGGLFAKQLDWRFIDLDQEIERREGRSVPQIFAESGEPYFRQLERRALVSMLGQRKIVLSLGGGAPEDLGNKLLLEQTPRTAIVHLAAPFTILVERCRVQEDAVERPVLADLDLAAKRFEVRRRVYERVADQTIDTSALDVAGTVEALVLAFQESSDSL
jgi:shikimate kinase